MYEYQKETLNYLEECRKRLEKLTDSKMSLKIGIVEGDYLNISGTKYQEEIRDLYFCINNSHGTFQTIGGIEYESSYGVDEDNVVRLNKNLFIELNKFIDKIYKNKKEREEFHEKLNKELEALNKSL